MDSYTFEKDHKLKMIHEWNKLVDTTGKLGDRTASAKIEADLNCKH